LRRGRFLRAAEWFNKSVEINDRLLTAYVGLGIAQHESGQLDQSNETFELAASVEPNSSLLFAETAKLQLRVEASRQANAYLADSSAGEAGQPRTSAVDRLLDEQIERHVAVLNRRPNHADLHYRLGLLLRQRGDIEAAIGSFRRAVAINPSYVKAQVKLGLALREAGHIEEAVATLKRAVEDQPGDVELHYQLGLMFADRNHFALALEQFEEARRHDSENIDLDANIALALQNLGLLDRAAVAWETLCEVAHDSEHGREVLDAASRMRGGLAR